MKNIVLHDATPLGLIDFANEVWNGGFDEHADLMYETLYIYTEESGRFRCVAEIDVECEGYTIEVVDRTWFDGGYQPGDLLRPGEAGRAIEELIEKAETAEKRKLYTPYIDIGKLDGSGNERWVKLDAAVTLGELESEEK